MTRQSAVARTVFLAGLFTAMSGGWTQLKGAVSPLIFGLGGMALMGLAAGFNGLSGFFHDSKSAEVTRPNALAVKATQEKD